MNEQEEEKMPDLLWSCFINWLNTIETAFKIKSEDAKNLKECLGIG